MPIVPRKRCLSGGSSGCCGGKWGWGAQGGGAPPAGPMRPPLFPCTHLKAQPSPSQPSESTFHPVTREAARQLVPPVPRRPGSRPAPRGMSSLWQRCSRATSANSTTGTASCWCAGEGSSSSETPTRGWVGGGRRSSCAILLSCVPCNDPLLPGVCSWRRRWLVILRTSFRSASRPGERI